MAAHSAEITSEFLTELKDHLVCRRVAQGMALLEGHRSVLDHFKPEQHHAGLFTGYLAQWVDLGFERPILVKKFLPRFSKAIRARLPLLDYLYLRMAEGMVAMSEESKPEAIRHFDFVLSLGDDTDDR